MTSEPIVSPTGDSRGEVAHGKEDASARKSDGAAARALAEAHERRARAAPPLPAEFNGRDGPEPVRYGDWEVRGIATDF
jgi:hypothetical protein